MTDGFFVLQNVKFILLIEKFVLHLIHNFNSIIMKTNYLFPYRLKKVSGIIFLISFITLTIFYCFDQFAHFEIKSKVFAVVGTTGFLGDNDWFGWVENSITDEILVVFSIAFGIMFAFSKEKHEDEMVVSVRLNSLAWATIINYVLIMLSYIFVYDVPFLTVMSAIMFSQLLIFIILFRYNIYKLNKAGADEE